MARKTIAALEHDLETIARERDALAAWFRCVQRGEQPYTLTIDDREDGQPPCLLDVYGVGEVFGDCVVVVRNLWSENSTSLPQDAHYITQRWLNEDGWPADSTERRLIRRMAQAIVAARGQAIGLR